MKLSTERFSPQALITAITRKSDSLLDRASALLERRSFIKILFLLVTIAGCFFLFQNWGFYYSALFGENPPKVFIVDRVIMDFPYYLLIGLALGTVGFLLPIKVLPELHLKIGRAHV